MLLPKWSSLCSGKSAWTLFSEWKGSTLYHSHTRPQVRDARYEKTFICNICDGSGTHVHPLRGSNTLKKPTLPPPTARHHLDSRKSAFFAVGAGSGIWLKYSVLSYLILTLSFLTQSLQTQGHGMLTVSFCTNRKETCRVFWMSHGLLGTEMSIIQ